MTITFYTNYSEKNHLDKAITQQGSITGTLREDCSIINPVIKIESFTNFDITTCNYCYIAEFGRYYFINNINCVNKLYEIHCHVDVLTTYKHCIRRNSAVVSRQERNYKNLTETYMSDYGLSRKQAAKKAIQQFPAGFGSFNLILSVSG